MSDASTSEPATQPEPEVDAAQQTQLHSPPDADGSAVLDANIAAGASTAPEGEAIANPIATNFSSHGTGDAKIADASTAVETDSAQGEQSEEGKVHLQNNSDIADKDSQGTLPNTDPTGLPIDTDVNRQE